MPIEEWREKDYVVMDDLASLAMNVNNNLNPLCDYVQGNEKIKVPDDLAKVINRLE